MGWSVSGAQVQYDNRAVLTFDYPVLQLTEVGEKAVVILDVPHGVVMTENVFGVSRDGTLLWQIERIAQTATSPYNLYVGVPRVEPEKGVVHIADSNGDVVDVDVSTGKVLAWRFLK